mmetsp:Transcript_3638/g.14293  ORF Transcript_3638/g.14293 Transcript_3638/m.14293 type:complete len:273 (-) Transcript_3638:1754-2572(-)
METHRLGLLLQRIVDRLMVAMLPRHQGGVLKLRPRRVRTAQEGPVVKVHGDRVIDVIKHDRPVIRLDEIASRAGEPLSLARPAFPNAHPRHVKQREAHVVGMHLLRGALAVERVRVVRGGLGRGKGRLPHPVAIAPQVPEYRLVQLLSSYPGARPQEERRPRKSWPEHLQEVIRGEDALAHDAREEHVSVQHRLPLGGRLGTRTAEDASGSKLRRRRIPRHVVRVQHLGGADLPDRPRRIDKAVHVSPWIDLHQAQVFRTNDRLHVPLAPRS